MARIRTVKPEFWEDEVVGMLPRDARLLFIATFNLADDEGLLRWTPAYIKASAFIYDEDVAIPQVARLMQALTDAGMVFPYIGGIARQQMACIVNFRKHQRINRPQKSKLPAPSLQSADVRYMYARRDAWTCQLCGEQIPQRPVRDDSHNLSIDHIKPQSAGGSDHPSNVRATHQGCNKARKDRPEGETFVPPPSMQGLNDSLNESVSGSLTDAYEPVGTQSDQDTPHLFTVGEKSSVNGSVNDSRTSSPPEGNGREGNGAGKGYTPTPPHGGGDLEPSHPVSGSDDDPQWLEFWDRYTNKVSKKKAREKFSKALEKVPFHRLMAGLDRYLTQDSRALDGYVKDPVTWLNGECWDDEPVRRINPAANKSLSGARGQIATAEQIASGEVEFRL